MPDWRTILTPLRKVPPGLRRMLVGSLAVLPTLVVVLAAAVYLFAVPRMDRLAPVAEQTLSSWLGEPVRIGTMRVGWDWGPDLRLTDLAVGSTTAPPLQVHSLHIGFFALPFLWGDYVVRRLEVRGADVDVRLLADGAWQVAGRRAGAGGAMPIDLDWARIRAEDLRLHFADTRAPSRDGVLQGGFTSTGGFRPRLRLHLSLPPQWGGGELRFAGYARSLLSNPLRSEGNGVWEARNLPLWLLQPFLPAGDLAFSGRLDGEGHLVWGRGGLEQGEGNLELADFRFTAPRWYPAGFALSRLGARWEWLGGRREGHLQLSELRAAKGGVDWGPLRLDLLFGRAKGSPIQVRSPRLPVKFILAVAPPAWLPGQGWLRAAQPRGTLEDLRVAVHPGGGGPFSASADLQGIHALPVGRWPGFRGLSGHLRVVGDGGELKLKSGDMDVQWPWLLPAPLALSSAKADLAWSAESGQRRFSVADLDLRGPAQVGGRAALTMPAQGAPRLDLDLRLENLPLARLPGLTPLQGIDPVFRDWLGRVFTAGQVTRARLRMDGPLDRFPFRDGHSGHFDLRAEFRNVGLQYAPDWPPAAGMDARLDWNGPGLVVTLQRGSIMGVPISRGTFRVADVLVHAPLLQLQIGARVPLAAAWDFLKASPILHGKALGQAPVTLSGVAPLDLVLRLPLDDSPTQVQGKVGLHHAALSWGPFRVWDILGNLTFTRNEIRLPSFQGTWLGGPLQGGVVASDLAATPRVVLGAQGEMEPERLAADLDMPAFRQVQGPLPYRFDGVLTGDEGQFAAVLPLRQVALHWPMPFGKAAGKADTLRLSGTGTLGRTLDLQAVLSRQAGRLRFVSGPDGWHLERGQWRLGSSTPPPLPPAGLLLSGSGGILPLYEWLSLGSSLGSSGMSGWPALHILTHWQGLRYDDREWPAFNLHGSLADGSLRLAVDGKAAQGKVRFAPAARGPAHLALDFKRLDIPAASGNPGGDSGRLAFAAGRPLQVAAQIGALQVGGHTLNDVQVRAERNASGWQFSSLEAEMAGARWRGEGNWSGPGAGRSDLKGTLEAADIGPFLRTFGIDSLAYGRADIDARLSWAGSPLVPDFARANGAVGLRIDDGRLGELNPSLAWLTLVNPGSLLTDIVTLNLRPFFGSGLFFQRLSAHLNLQDGVAHSNDIILRSSALRATAQGDIDLARKWLDLGLRIYPLQTWDFLVGHFPILGPAIFGKSGAVMEWRYRVRGPWDDPQVRKE